jgi:methionine-rich copper-binding protein CopC
MSRHSLGRCAPLALHATAFLAVAPAAVHGARARRHAPIVANVADMVVPGVHTGHWSTAGQDGHAAKGTSDFVVKSAR